MAWTIATLSHVHDAVWYVFSVNIEDFRAYEGATKAANATDVNWIGL